MPTAQDDQLVAFVDFLNTQNVAPELSYEEVAQAGSTADLGISSLNIILVVVNYLKEATGDTVDFDPDWVPLLDSVAGVRTVIATIDRSRLPQPSAT